MKTEQKKQFKEIALEEFKKGKKPEEVFEEAVAAGANQEEVIEAMEEFANESLPAVFAPLVKKFLGKKIDFYRKEENKAVNKKLTWDPVEEDIHEQDFQYSINELSKKYESYKKHPYKIFFNLILALIPIFLIIAVIVLYPDFALYVLGKSDDAIGLVIIPFGFLIWYVRKVSLMQRDMVKLMIAKKNNWLYSPIERRSRWKLFVEKFPEIFQKGNQNQNMQDEFWGNFDSGMQNVPFYASVFVYEVRSKDSKGRSSTIHYQKTVVAIKLNKKLKSDFRLEPEGLLQKFFNFFSSKEIEMESAEFNDKFAFFYNGKKADQELEIVKTLSPSVQVRILQMAREQKPFILQFKDDLALFVFNGRMMKKMKTNFFRKIAIDQRDIDELNQWLNNMLNIASDIVPFLD